MIFDDFIKNNENVTLEMVVSKLNELESKLNELNKRPEKEEKEEIDPMQTYFNEVIK